VEEWDGDVWPRGPRLQGEEAGKAGPREEQQNKLTTEQQNINRTAKHYIHTSKQNIRISVGFYRIYDHYTWTQKQKEGQELDPLGGGEPPCRW
jgi:hypothetical protein